MKFHLPQQIQHVGLRYLHALARLKQRQLVPAWLQLQLLLGGSSPWQLILGQQFPSDLDFYISGVRPADKDWIKTNIGYLGQCLANEFLGAILPTNRHPSFFQFNESGNDLTIGDWETYSSHQVGFILGESAEVEVYFDPHFPEHPEAFRVYREEHQIMTPRLGEIIREFYSCSARRHHLEATLQINILAYVIKSYDKPLQIPEMTFSRETALVLRQLIQSHTEIWGRVKTRLESHYKIYSDDKAKLQEHLKKIWDKVNQVIEHPHPHEEALKGDNARLHLALEKIQKDEANVRQELTLLSSTHEATVYRMSTETSKLEEEKSKQSEELASLKKELEEEKAKHAQELATLRKQLETEKARTQAVQDEVEKLRPAEKAVTRLKADVKNEQKKSAELARELGDTKIAAAKQKDELMALGQESKKREGEVKALKQELASKDLTLESVQQQFNEVSEQLLNEQTSLSLRKKVISILRPGTQEPSLSMAAMALPPITTQSMANAMEQRLTQALKVINREAYIIEMMLAMDQSTMKSSETQSPQVRLSQILDALKALHLMMPLPLFADIEQPVRDTLEFLITQLEESTLKEEISRVFLSCDQYVSHLQKHKGLIQKACQEERGYSQELNGFYGGYQVEHFVRQAAMQYFVQVNTGISLQDLTKLMERCKKEKTAYDDYMIWSEKSRHLLKKYGAKNGKGPDPETAAVPVINAIFSAYRSHYPDASTEELLDKYFHSSIVHALPPNNNEALPSNHPLYTQLSCLLSPKKLDLISESIGEALSNASSELFVLTLKEFRERNVFCLSEAILNNETEMMNIMLMMLKKYQGYLGVCLRNSTQIQTLIMSLQVKTGAPVHLGEKERAEKQIWAERALLIIRDRLSFPEEKRFFRGTVYAAHFDTIKKALSQKEIKELSELVVQVMRQGDMKLMDYVNFMDGLVDITVDQILVLKDKPNFIPDDAALQLLALSMLQCVISFVREGVEEDDTEEHIAFLRSSISFLIKILSVELYTHYKGITFNKRVIAIYQHMLNKIQAGYPLYYSTLHSFERIKRIAEVYYAHEHIISNKNISPPAVKLKEFNQDYVSAIIYGGMTLGNEKAIACSIAAKNSKFQHLTLDDFRALRDRAPAYGIVMNESDGLYSRWANVFTHSKKKPPLVILRSLLNLFRDKFEGFNTIAYLHQHFMFLDITLATGGVSQEEHNQLKFAAVYTLCFPDLLTRQEGLTLEYIDNAVSLFRQENPFSMPKNELDDKTVVLKILELIASHAMYLSTKNPTPYKKIRALVKMIYRLTHERNRPEADADDDTFILSPSMFLLVYLRTNYLAVYQNKPRLTADSETADIQATLDSWSLHSREILVHLGPILSQDRYARDPYQNAQLFLKLLNSLGEKEAHNWDLGTSSNDALQWIDLALFTVRDITKITGVTVETELKCLMEFLQDLLKIAQTDFLIIAENKVEFSQIKSAIIHLARLFTPASPLWNAALASQDRIRSIEALLIKHRDTVLYNNDKASEGVDATDDFVMLDIPIIASQNAFEHKSATRNAVHSVKHGANERITYTPDLYLNRNNLMYLISKLGDFSSGDPAKIIGLLQNIFTNLHSISPAASVIRHLRHFVLLTVSVEDCLSKKEGTVDPKTIASAQALTCMSWATQIFDLATFDESNDSTLYHILAKAQSKLRKANPFMMTADQLADDLLSLKLMSVILKMMLSQTDADPKKFKSLYYLATYVDSLIKEREKPRTSTEMTLLNAPKDVKSKSVVMNKRNAFLKLMITYNKPPEEILEKFFSFAENLSKTEASGLSILYAIGERLLEFNLILSAHNEMDSAYKNSILRSVSSLLSEKFLLALSEMPESKRTVAIQEEVIRSASTLLQNNTFKLPGVFATNTNIHEHLLVYAVKSFLRYSELTIDEKQVTMLKLIDNYLESQVNDKCDSANKLAL